MEQSGGVSRDNSENCSSEENILTQYKISFAHALLIEKVPPWTTAE